MVARRTIRSVSSPTSTVLQHVADCTAFCTIKRSASPEASCASQCFFIQQIIRCLFCRLARNWSFFIVSGVSPVNEMLCHNCYLTVFGEPCPSCLYCRSLQILLRHLCTYALPTQCILVDDAYVCKSARSWDSLNECHPPPPRPSSRLSLFGTSA